MSKRKKGLGMWSSRGVAWLLLSLLSMGVAVGCGGSMQGQGLTSLERLSDETLEVELSDDATWIAVATLGGEVFALGQTSDQSQLFGSRDRHLAAFSSESGEELWRSSFLLPEDAIPSYYSDLISTESVLVMLADYAFLGLSPSDGSVLWTINNQHQALRLIGVDQDVIYARSDPNLIYAFNARSGGQIAQWTLPDYHTFSDVWLTRDSDYVVAVVGAASSPGEKAIVRLDTRVKERSEIEVLYRFEPKLYGEGNTLHLYPSHYTGSSPSFPGKSDHVIKLFTDADDQKILAECWSVVSLKKLWEVEITLRDGEHLSDNTRIPPLLITSRLGLRQRRATPGLLLGESLRLDMKHLGSFKPAWTNLLPTQHKIEYLTEVADGVLLVRTMPITNGTDRWFLLSGDNGRLLWMSTKKRIYGNTRSIAVRDNTVVRLRTADWIDGKLYIDRVVIPGS